MVSVSWGDDTVTTNSPDELLKIQVLIRRAEANDALRAEEERLYKFNKEPLPGRYQSYLMALWREIQTGYEESRGYRLDEGDPLKLGFHLYTRDITFERLRRLHTEIERYLYEKGVTKYKQFSDPKSPERML